jgi:hypothetical protein
MQLKLRIQKKLSISIRLIMKISAFLVGRRGWKKNSTNF